MHDIALRPFIIQMSLMSFPLLILSTMYLQVHRPRQKS